MPPDNTAHIFQKGYSKGPRAGHDSSQNEDTARTGAVLPAHHRMKDLTPWATVAPGVPSGEDEQLWGPWPGR